MYIDFHSFAGKNEPQAFWKLYPIIWNREVCIFYIIGKISSFHKCVGIRRGCIEVCAKLPHKRQLSCFLWCWFQLLCPCNALSCCQFSAKIAGDIEVSNSFCKKRQLCKRVIVKKAANTGYINEHSHCSRELIISLYSVPLDGIWNTASSFGLPHTRQTFSAFSRGYWGGVGSSTWPVRRHRGKTGLVQPGAEMSLGRPTGFGAACQCL